MVTLQSEADSLAQRCADVLAALAAAGGPSVEVHLDDLRRWLTRRSPSGGRRARRAVAAIRAGRTDTLLAEDVTDPRALQALTSDLRAIDRALATAARVRQPL